MMTWKDVFLPWGALEDARNDIKGLTFENANQRITIKKLIDEGYIMKSRISIQKDEIMRLHQAIEALPKRNELGRFTSKKTA